MYAIIDNTTVLRIVDSTYIPMDTENVDYQMYLQWVAEGNQPKSDLEQ